MAQTEKEKQPRRKTKDLPKREYDNALHEINSQIEADLTEYLGHFAAKCPECGQADYGTSHALSEVLGPRTKHDCKKCGRNFTEDDGRYRNMALEALQLRNLIRRMIPLYQTLPEAQRTQSGIRETARQAVKVLTQYGINTQNTKTVTLLGELVRER